MTKMTMIKATTMTKKREVQTVIKITTTKEKTMTIPTKRNMPKKYRQPQRRLCDKQQC